MNTTMPIYVKSPPLVYCLRKGLPMAITAEQFKKWFQDSNSATCLTKVEYLKARREFITKPVVKCLNKACGVELKPHESGYCLECVHNNNLEYAVEEGGNGYE